MLMKPSEMWAKKFHKIWNTPGFLASKCLAHWDDKITKPLDGGKIKLLGVPSIVTKFKGKYVTTASSTIKKELYNLKCTHKVFRMVFDTSVSNMKICNTGEKVVLVFFLQEMWHINILWFTCSHHVGEVILSHVWDSLEIQPSKAPTINIFKK